MNIPKIKQNTKTLLLIALAVLLMTALFSCTNQSPAEGEHSDEETETQSRQTSVEQTEDTPEKTQTKTSSPQAVESRTSPLKSSQTTTPSPSQLPENWRDYPVIPNVSPTAIEIYLNGIAMGNDPHKFSKIGDCQNITTYFLAVFETPDLYSLGEEYGYLQEVIDWYFGSYSRESIAVRGGLNVARVLSPFHANADLCEPNEHSLACEVRLNNPSIALVSLEENWSSRTAEEYEEHLRNIIEYLIGEGVLPILATKADNLEGDHSINATIVKLAAEYEIPLWNFWLSVQPLPNHGLRKEGFHLTLAGPYFDSEWHMRAGWVWRNLTALQVLDAIWRAVNQP